MILSDLDIKREIAAKRIVFTPKLESSQIGGASVDLTLEGKFWVFKKEVLGKKIIDLDKTHFSDSIEEHKWNFIILEPGAMCHGITREKIRLAPDIMGTLEGRSKYARMGLAVHVTSALVQPGSDNHQVLEIVNMAPFPIKISEGMRISQIVFEYLNSASAKPYAKFGKVARRQ
ncbi:MAG: dCTP deaminase [Candidatus Micrarchaeia archaeon]|jgi:dCTP deaminase